MKSDRARVADGSSGAVRRAGRHACARVASIVVALGTAHCVEPIEVGILAGTGGAESGGAEGGAGLPVGAAGSFAGGGLGSGGALACAVTECLGKTYECGNCVDDDADGSTDAADSECLGPCDLTESALSASLPAPSTGSCRQDCYFDGDTGSGNDGCSWSQRCDDLSVAPDYPPSGDAGCEYDPATNLPGAGGCVELALEQSAECLDYCGPLTPNGCDCFGCCELPARSGSFVWIGSQTAGEDSCDLARLDDPTSCRPCTPVQGCMNSCATCEFCVGGAVPEPSCGAPDPCPEGEPCGTGEAQACPPEYYCLTGCCVSAPL